jgi:hypothetical protein
MSQTAEIPVADATSIRKRGLLHFALWMLAFLGAMAVPVLLLPRLGFQLSPFGMIPFALPGAFALKGLLEFVTGFPFLELARRWDELKGWQRGVLGTIIVLVALVVIIGGVGLVLSQLG